MESVITAELLKDFAKCSMSLQFSTLIEFGVSKAIVVPLILQFALSNNI